MISFNRFNGTKEDFDLYKSSLGLSEEDIVFISDNATNKFIYANGTYFGSTEIYKGSIEPTDESIKLWIDTNEQSIKYKDNNDTWVTISSGEGNLIYIGDKKPGDDTEYKVWISPDEVIEDDEEPLIIDTELNPDSINPVQNSTITAEFNKYLKKTDAEAFITEDEVAEQYQPKGDYLTAEDLPVLADVAYSGNFNDLVNIPDFNLTKDSCTVYSYTYEESSYAPFTSEQRASNAEAFQKIRQALSDKKDINITVVVVYDSGENIEYRDCYITGTTYTSIESGGSGSSILTSVSIESATIIQDINKPYLSHVKIDRFGNDAEYPDSAGSVEADVTKTYLVLDKDLDKHTTTYIGTENPSTISSKYNLWVDTSKEEVVFKYKDSSNTWQILSTGDTGNITVDTELKATSENPIANKAVYAMAVSVEEGFSEIDENLSKKANTENGLVEGRGFKVSDTEKYYLPGTTIPSDGVENTNILATKAEVLSNEVIDSKATVYNLYAMDPLSEEQLEANAKALESVQNREVAIYKVYTNDDTYAIADVKLVPSLYLEAYVYVSNPDTTSKQATITKYTYTFNQAGEYTTSDKQEVVVPSLSKVEEIVVNSGGGGTASEGVKMYQVYLDPANDAEKAVNVEAYNAIKNSEDAVFYYNETVDNTTIRHSLTTLMSTDDLVGVQFTYLATVIGTSDTDSNGIGEYGIKYSLRIINSSGSTTALIKDSEHRLPTVTKVEEMISEASTTSIEVDSVMSETSENAVSNKVIKEYVDNAVAQAITTTLNTEV
jgi:hypothetical protein